MLPEDIRKTWGAFKFYSLTLIVFAMAIYLAFRYGYHSQQEAALKIAQTQHTVENLTAENQRLVQQLNILGVEIEVQRLSAQKSQQIIEDGLEREASLREEVTFYQRVMAPELEEGGFVISALEVNQSKSDRGYRYQIVLMQQDKIKQVVKGEIDVIISGSLEGQPHNIALDSLKTASSGQLSFSFKYFQTIDGEIVLPEGFVPEKVKVTAEVFQFRRKKGSLEKTFDWLVEDLSPS